MAVLERTASVSTGTSSTVEEDEDAEESVVTPVGVSMSAKLLNVGSPSTETKISVNLKFFCVKIV